MNAPTAIPAAHRMIPLSESEVRALVEENERLRFALAFFATWRRPSSRDWENGSVQDEFDAMRERAKAALQSRSPLRVLAADTNVDARFRQILANTNRPLSSYGREDHDMSTDGRPLKEGT